MLSLREQADAIPELGHGGREIANVLTSLAAKVDRGHAIVDIGPYLGSTTAYLALGATAGTPIHAFDAWDASLINLRAKARWYHDMEIPDNLMPLFLQNVAPFATNLVAHRMRVENFEWSHGPIGLLVDDFGVDPEHTEVKMREMDPCFVRGASLVLMDFFWYERKRGAEFTGLRDYMDRHRDRYRYVGRAGKVAAIFEVR